MSWYSNFIDNMAQSNKDYYKEITQEWINDTFEDTTLNTIIKEEKYPFNEQYKSFDVLPLQSEKKHIFYCFLLLAVLSHQP